MRADVVLGAEGLHGQVGLILNALLEQVEMLHPGVDQMQLPLTHRRTRPASASHSHTIANRRLEETLEEVSARHGCDQ